MLSDKLVSALSEQMTNEFHAGYTYLAMAAHFEAEDFAGFAHFFRVQAQEELLHAMKFFDFLSQAGARARLGAVAEPRGTYAAPRDAFEIALRQEKEVTSSINELMDVAIGERAHAANVFLQWFVTEQMEEEALFSRLVKKFELIKDDGHGLMLLDREMGQRQTGS